MLEILFEPYTRAANAIFGVDDDDVGVLDVTPNARNSTGYIDLATDLGNDPFLDIYVLCDSEWSLRGRRPLITKAQRISA